MKKNIDLMAQIPEKINILVLEGTRMKEGGSILENKERCHALVVVCSSSYSFTIDLCVSRHMDSMHEYFSALHPYSGPSILMGDDSEIEAKGIGKIDLEDEYFNNVLFVLDLAANLLSIY